MARPFWSGQVQISLVSFGVKLFPATEAKSEIHFHEISKKSGARVRHQKVSSSDDAPVEKDEIVKGYEYSKGEYIQIDPKEIEQLRISSGHTLEVRQFVSLDEIDPAMFEKPYFVVPENNAQAEAFGVVRKALLDTRKAGLGKIALGGREHLIALSPPADTKLPGMIAYLLRYEEEMRSAAEYFAEIKAPTIDSEQLSLAKELIERKASKFDPTLFKDEYEAALHELVNAKLKHLPLPAESKPTAGGKVINLMEALRQSVNGSDKKSVAHTARNKSKGHATNQGLTLVKAGGKTGNKRRKSA